MKNLILILLLPVLFSGCPNLPRQPELAVKIRNNLAQIEIGSYFVGLEMHRGAPRLNRISFYYPVANSIDASEDYWQRENYHVQKCGIKIDENPIEWLPAEPWECQLTPYSADFSKTDSAKTLVIRYRFCLEKPAFVTEIEITNNAPVRRNFELHTRQNLALRTCHSYHLKNPTALRADTTGTIFAQFDDPATQFAEIFMTNVGEFPSQWKTSFSESGIPAATGCYRKALAPGKKMRIIQIMGSAKPDEAAQLTAELRKNYESEIQKFEQIVQDEIFHQAQFKTSVAELDHSVNWAKGILAVNRHYIDGTIQPMPCPAEYNFYFTHDVLVTDLAAVNFDLARVKQDLEFIVQHASDEKIIPHAYYWKDNQFQTEFAASDNWNHFWFVQLTASYLRHSHDLTTAKQLLPFVEKSVAQSLQSRKQDGLMWANHPDWWDIGRSFGPRAYMTILMIRTLADFNYLLTQLEAPPGKCQNYEKLAQEMRTQLMEKLWDANRRYLMNYYADGTQDPHFYIGSLLAAHFGLLERSRRDTLLASAEKNLLHPELGIYNAFPMDFHELIDFLHLNGNEAGAPYFYMNGGIWPQGNAWYALGLMAANQKRKALNFIQKTMTLAGVMHSPNGQPAMYEYRHAASGKIDKPQFMWAAGWFLYCLYHLYGLEENAWNLSLEPFLAPGQEQAKFDLQLAGKPVRVKIDGNGKNIRKIRFDGKLSSSAVIPAVPPAEKIEIELGAPDMPYLALTDAMVERCVYLPAEKLLKISLRAFPGHRNTTRIVGPDVPQSIFLNTTKALHFTRPAEDSLLIEFEFTHQNLRDEIVIQF